VHCNIVSTSVADPNSGCGVFFTPGSGIRDGKNPEPGPEMKIPDRIFENLVSVFWVKIFKFFDADPDPGSCQPWIWDPGWKKNRI
jgi:hypothetical protein